MMENKQTQNGKNPDREKQLKEQREKLRKKKEAEEFKRRYFNHYDDVKISYKEDW